MSPDRSDTPDGRARPDDFVELERLFTRHIRDRDQPAPSGLEDRRVGIYRDLVYNSIQGLLASYFPVLRRLLGDEEWHAMMRDYVRRHAARTPLFPHMSAELVRYLESERERTSDDPPWLLDLARYEAATREIAIDTAEIPVDGVDAEGDLLKEVPVLNPLARLLSYDYPVHRIKPSYRPREPSPTHLIVCRDRNDDMRYLVANAATVRLFIRLEENPDERGEATGAALVREFSSLPPEVVLAGVGKTLRQLRLADIIIGTVSA